DELRRDAQHGLSGGRAMIARESLIAIDLDKEQRQRRSTPPPLGEAANQVIEKCRSAGDIWKRLVEQCIGRGFRFVQPFVTDLLRGNDRWLGTADLLTAHQAAGAAVVQVAAVAASILRRIQGGVGTADDL